MSEIMKELKERLEFSLEVKTLTLEARILYESMIKILKVIRSLETPEQE